MLDPQVLESLLGDSMDERTRKILDAIAAQTHPAREDAPDDDLSQLDNRSGADARGRRWSGARRRRARQLAEELKELRHRNEMLARALGACAGCWGEAEECEACSGEGAPGTYELDEDLYEAVVVPAVALHDHMVRQDAEVAKEDPHTPREGGSQP